MTTAVWTRLATAQPLIALPLLLQYLDYLALADIASIVTMARDALRRQAAASGPGPELAVLDPETWPWIQKAHRMDALLQAEPYTRQEWRVGLASLQEHELV